MNLNCILIDDEADALEVLSNLIRLYHPELKIAAACTTIFSGLQAIKKHKPNLVFIDITMPGASGLEIAREIGPSDTRIIFTTAHPNHTLNTFKVSAFDYLLKPIDPDDLKQTILRYRQQLQPAAGREHGHLIRLHDRDSTLFVEPDQIMYVRARRRYSDVFLNDKRYFMLTRNIGDLQHSLPARLFLRPHKSYLVNVSGIDKISHRDGGFLVLKSGVEIEIARRKRVEIIRRLSGQLS